MRFIALLFLVALFVVSGIDKLQSPQSHVKVLMNTQFPSYLKHAGVKFGNHEATLLVQALGAAFIGLSAMIVTGLFRGTAAFLLAAMLVPITLFVHVNLNDPVKTKPEDLAHVMKNLAIMGGLLSLTFAPKVKRALIGDSKKKN
jgi:uncharacterized membrane protein YphA (DoxX/SURF4 family)